MKLIFTPWILAVLTALTTYGQTINVQLRACLEGPFDGIQMGTLLNSNNYLPLAQPYNTAPWNYQGTESVAAIPNANVVDWVLVELRETAGDASMAYKGNTVATQAGFILKNGNIVALNGINTMQFNVAVTQNLYVVVYHRNHLPVLSGSALVYASGVYAHNFTTGANQAYGGSNAHKEISPGVWGMISGDGDANGQVNNADKNDVWKPQSGSSGYKAGDFSMNGQVDNVDKIEIWKGNSGKSSQVVGAWTCGKPMADMRDGQIYNTVQIGTQCWMAENLNTGTRIAVSVNQSDNGVIEKYCYDNLESNCDVYGGLYQWNEMMQYVTTPAAQGICPPGEGFHLPTDAEWCVLEQYLDPTISCSGTSWRGTDGGGKLKETGTVHWCSPNVGATNSSGFTALGGGDCAPGVFMNILNSGDFWTTTARGVANAYMRGLGCGSAQVYRDDPPIYYGFSVRCLKTDNQAPDVPSNPNPPDNSTTQQINSQLSWICTDPDNDPVTFDVYFGTVNPPALVSTGQTETTYNPGALAYATTYYWKIAAHDDHGHSTEGPVWSFGTVLTFQCGGPLVDTRDNRSYATVQIGTQCWMAENLNTGTRIAVSVNQSDNGVIEKYCYDNLESNCDVYGGLYQWNEMMQYVTTPAAQGICPPGEGFHLPTDAEWCVLEQYLDPTISCSGTSWRGTDGGGKLKETDTVHWCSPNVGATNSSGFTALGSGRSAPGVFMHISIYGDFWTTTARGVANAYMHGLGCGNALVYRDDPPAYYGFSVRCIKTDNQAPDEPSNPNPPDNSTAQQINSQPSWTCIDPDNDPVTFDVYFGTVNPPALVSTGQTETTYNPGALAYATTYYWKIAAHDDHGHSTEGPVWSFGTVLTFQCGGPLVDTRDNRSYATVQIGTQCWMAENLNTGTRIAVSVNQSDNGVIEKYCYDNLESNCDVYGGLYQWNEMMQYVTTPAAQGICPPGEGFHLPTDAEWCVLEQYLDPTISCSGTSWRGTDGGGKLKETGTVHWCSPNVGATNSSGFTALGGGDCAPGVFMNILNSGDFWTTTARGVANAYMRGLGCGSAQVYRDDPPIYYGFSVRCLKTDNQAPDVPSNPNPPDNSTTQQINSQLSWICTDPDNDPVTFDVYFGTVNPPALVSTGQTETTYNPGALAYATTYYWKIAAHDDHGHSTEGPVWSFGTVLTFQCGGPLVDTRDNRSYATVQIGTQCWMAENLNTGTRIAVSVNQSDNGVIEKYCYDNLESNCDVYGGLYQWNEMMQYVTTPAAQGICPPGEGFHLPTDAEWCVLEQYLDPTISCSGTSWRGTDGGGKLKETDTVHWCSPNVGATNSSGFTALGGGDCAPGVFMYISIFGDFWTTTGNGTNAYMRGLSCGNALVYRDDPPAYYGFSVRCIKTDNQAPDEPSNPNPPDNSTAQQINSQPSWTCIDPDNDPVTFDVYFGTVNPPALVSTGQTETTYNPGALAYATTYYWKIVAHDDHGHTTAGPIWSFTTWQCGDNFVDPRDNQEYATIQIGTQCWMAENMNIGTMISGSNNQTDNGIIEKYCYDNDTSKCSVYGGLYQWDEMMQYVTTPGVKGICPDGWHLPTDAEYCTLTQFIDPTVSCGDLGWSGTDVGIKMKSTTGWFGGGNGTNTSGFTALPGGYCNSDGGFYNLTYYMYFWSSTEYSSNFPWYRYLYYNNATVFRSHYNKERGFSVRCVKD